MNLLQAGALFTSMAALHAASRHSAIKKACEIVEKEAKDVIGTYRYGWPQLADSTKEDRVQKGFSENEPLLRTGELQKSIENSVSGDSGRVGTNDDKAVWQELGTQKIPPRSFLMQAAMHKRDEVGKLIGMEIFGTLVKAR